MGIDLKAWAMPVLHLLRDVRVMADPRLPLTVAIQPMCIRQPAQVWVWNHYETSSSSRYFRFGCALPSAQSIFVNLLMVFLPCSACSVDRYLSFTFMCRSDLKTSQPFDLTFKRWRHLDMCALHIAIQPSFMHFGISKPGSLPKTLKIICFLLST